MSKTQNIRPPKWPLKLLELFILHDYLEEIEGDLEELYQSNLEKHSKLKSQWLYTLEVIKLLRPILLKNLEGTYKMNNYGIMKNYFKIALRNIKANKFQNFIKTAGLTIAIATSITIYQYISFEKSFDNFHSEIDNLYRIEVDRIHSGVIQSQKSTSYSAFGPDAMEDISGIAEFARVRIRNSSIVISKDAELTTFNIQKPAFVDPAFLSLFDFGLKNTAVLEAPNAIVLTETTASKYFGDEDPLGKTVTFIHGRYELPLVVKAIIPDVNRNSHIQFEALVPYYAFYPEKDWVSHSWDWSGVTTYFKLRPEVSPSELESAFPDFVKKHKGDKMKERDMNYEFSLRPVRDIHLQGHLDGELEANGNEQSLYFLGVAALLILTISWLNNVNLTTAHNTTRTKEMSVRRVLGAHKEQVFMQLFVESLLTHVLAVVIAVSLILTTQDLTERWLDISLNMDVLFQWNFWCFAFFYIMLGCAFVSFDYRLIFNSFNPTNPSIFFNKQSRLSLRKIGVCFQFGILLALMAMTWTVNSQLDFIQNFNLGLNKDNIIVIEKPRVSRAEQLNSTPTAFQDQLQNLSWVKAYTSSFQVPGGALGWSGGIRQTTQPKDYGQDLYVSTVSDNYIETLGLQIIAGSSFENISCEKHSHVILNKSATRLLGFDSPEDAIQTDLINSTDRKQRIIGVVDDFHYNSLKDPIEPMMLSHLSRPLDYVFVSLETGNLYEQMDQMEVVWEEVYPSVPFKFFFLNDHIDQQYKTDTEFKKLFTAFSGVATWLALMGILGLSSFYAARRIKEIGIRKVLGASLTSIIWLLSSRFMLLITIGSIVAIPISYYFISLWLQNFAYQIQVSWVWFIGSFLLVLSLSWLILGSQTIKAASINPSACLKDE